MLNGRKNSLFGSAMLLICALVWGFALVAQSKGSDHLDAVTFNGFRFMIAAVCIAAFLIVKTFIERKLGRQSVGWNKNTVLGGILCGVALFCACNAQQYGIAFTTVGKASFITAMYIVIVPVLGLLMRRRAGVLCMFAIVVSVIGFYLMCLGENFDLNYGDLMVLLCAVLFSIQILFIDFFGENSDPIRLTLMQFIVAAIISLPAMAIAGFPSPSELESGLIPILYVGLCSTGIGYTLQTIGQKHTEPALATLIMSLESVIGLIAGVIFLRESYTVRELGGCLLVLIGVFTAQFEIPHRFLSFDRRFYDVTSPRKHTHRHL